METLFQKIHKIHTKVQFVALLVLLSPVIAQTSSFESCDIAQTGDHSHQIQVGYAQVSEHLQFVKGLIQRILQMVSASNQNIVAQKDRTSTIEELAKLQQYCETVEDLYRNENSIIGLVQAIVTTNVMIEFLDKAIQGHLAGLDVSQLVTAVDKSLIVIHKRSATISIDKLNDYMYMIAMNESMMATLQSHADSIGWTWYNKFYRAAQKYNHNYHVATYAKNAAIAGALLFATCYVANMVDFRENLKNIVGFDLQAKLPSVDGLYTQYVGDVVKVVPTQFIKSIDSTTGKEVCSSVSGFILHDDFTPFSQPDWSSKLNLMQRLSVSLQKFSQNGVINLSQVVGAIAPAAILKGLATKPYGWLQTTASKASLVVDAVLKGESVHKFLKGRYYSEPVYFKDLVGCSELEALAKRLASYIKNPERYTRQQTDEHKGILLYGPPQTGKTLFAKALQTLIQEEMGDQECKFIDYRQEQEFLRRQYNYEFTLKDAFDMAKSIAPCIVFIDELDLLNVNREKNSYTTTDLLTGMQGIDSSKQVIVVATTNSRERLDKSLLIDGRFGKQIYVGYPDYNSRKQFLEKEIIQKRKFNHISLEFINSMAQEADGCSYNMLRRIVTEAVSLSTQSLRMIKESDFEIALDTEVRKIIHDDCMTQQEKMIIATYQAGKALARHLLPTSRSVVKATILPIQSKVKVNKYAFAMSDSDATKTENEKLASEKEMQVLLSGQVFTVSQLNSKAMISDLEMKYEAMILLAGSVAQELFLGATYSNCNPQDRADAMTLIHDAVSSGEKLTEALALESIKIKAAYQKELVTVLQKNKELFIKIRDYLVQHNTIDRDAWNALVG